MNDTCGIEIGGSLPARAPSCAALSGLGGLLPLTQGVALGWFVVAPLGLSRKCTGTVLSILATLLVLGSSSFAADSPLADAAEKSDRAAVRALLKQRADVNAPQ